ncbi:MAG: ABC transporter substrate-binding protein [Holophagales bacterium]|jgi:iron complex transport system substrate-binding protein|nr:ABC transporter substrate-binding protein [Holophagales bacterium]
MRKVFLVCFCFLGIISAGLAASPPKRVVSQTVGTDDLLLALADPGQIAALSYLAHDPLHAPEAALAINYPKLSSSSAEDILRFKPDIVLVTSFSPQECVAILKQSGVRVFILEKFETLDDVYTSILQLGDVLGQREKAEALVAACRARVSSLNSALKGVRPVRVISAGVYPFISGSGTSFQDLCDNAGAINVAAEKGIKGDVPTPVEKILSWKIDYLIGFTDQRKNGLGPTLKESLKNVAPYRFLAAYKAGRIIEMPVALFLATSHNRIAAFEMLAKALHPEL